MYRFVNYLALEYLYRMLLYVISTNKQNRHNSQQICPPIYYFQLKIKMRVYNNDFDVSIGTSDS